MLHALANRCTALRYIQMVATSSVYDKLRAFDSACETTESSGAHHYQKRSFSQSHLACSVSATSKSPRGFCSHSQSAGLPSSIPITVSSLSLLAHGRAFFRSLIDLHFLLVLCCNPCRAVSTCVFVSSAASSVLIWMCHTGSILSASLKGLFELLE